MPTLFHDGNFLPYLVFGSAQLVGDGCVRRGRKVLSSHHGPLLSSRVMTLDGFDCLQRQRENLSSGWTNSRSERRRTDHLSPIIV
jgi:hypothetical protein